MHDDSRKKSFERNGLVLADVLIDEKLLSIRLEEVKPKFRLWLEYRGKSILGKGGADILKVLEKYGSIERAAKETPYSYRFIWGYLEKLNKRVGRPVVKTYRGGFKGGGGVELTEVGKALLARYKSLEKLVDGTIKRGFS